MPSCLPRGATAVLAAALAGLGPAGPARSADGAAADAAAAQAPDAGRYRVSSSYSMPHLDAALRPAALTEERCVAAGDAGAFFPLLSQPHLRGCTLQRAARADGALGYWLRCDQPGGPSGTALIVVDAPQRLSGVLDLKMGGKNMTLTQRMAAQRLGPCE